MRWVTARAGGIAGVDTAVRSVSNCVVLVRRAAVWLSTVGVALIVALAMPVSQLRTMSVVKACCCPDPSNCHCPDHDWRYVVAAVDARLP